MHILHSIHCICPKPNQVLSNGIAISKITIDKTLYCTQITNYLKSANFVIQIIDITEIG